MNILILSGQYPPHTKGGGEISTHLIARGLHELGHSVTVLTEGSTSHEELDGVSVIRHELGLLRKPLFERHVSKNIAKKIQGLIDFSEYDIIHAHDFRSVMAVYEADVPEEKFYATLRDYAAISGDTNNFLRDYTIPEKPLSWISQIRSHRVAEAKGLRKIGRMLQYVVNIGYRRRVFSSLPHYVFISDAQRALITTALPSTSDARITTIYNPIDPAYITLPATGLRNQHEVLYIGRVEDYKGVDLLLHAWVEVQKQFSQARLRIVGDGAQREEYEAFARENGITKSVVFQQFTEPDKIIELYDQTEVLVSPHQWIEPFGRTIIEALSRGVFVLAANHGGPAEILSAAHSGALFDAGDSESLAQHLLQALAFSDENGGSVFNAGRDWVAENLSISRIAQQYVDFYAL